MEGLPKNDEQDLLKRKMRSRISFSAAQQIYVAKEERALIEKLVRQGIAVRKT